MVAVLPAAGWAGTASLRHRWPRRPWAKGTAWRPIEIGQRMGKCLSKLAIW